MCPQEACYPLPSLILSFCWTEFGSPSDQDSRVQGKIRNEGLMVNHFSNLRKKYCPDFSAPLLWAFSRGAQKSSQWRHLLPMPPLLPPCPSSALLPLLTFPCLSPDDSVVGYSPFRKGKSFDFLLRLSTVFLTLLTSMPSPPPCQHRINRPPPPLSVRAFSQNYFA